jgi:hypothetical protein
MRLPLSNAPVLVTNGYKLDNSTPLYRTTYTYTKGQNGEIASSHKIVKYNGTEVYSNSTPLSLKICDMVMSEIKNWGEFTAYTSVAVNNDKGEVIQIRPIVSGTSVVLSAYNTVTTTEQTICSYGTSETGELPSGLSFALNIGTITFQPETGLYLCSCSAYAISGQSGCGFDGIGSITIAFDTEVVSYSNIKYKVTEVTERKTI